MRKYRLYQCLVGTALFLGLALPAWAETVELVTYYPTSANITDDFRVKSLTVGTAYKTTPTTLQDGVALISNRLGIGTTDPNEALHISQPLGVQTAIRLDTVNNDSGGSILSLRRMRLSTDASPVPLAVNAGDVLGEVHFMGYDGAGYEVAAAIRGLAEGSWTSGASGSRPAMLQFYTRSAVAGDLPAERMRITSDGALELVGLNTPPAVSADNRGRIYYNSTTDTFMISESGRPYRNLAGVRRMRVYDDEFPRIENPTSEQRQRYRNPPAIDTGVRVTDYPIVVPIFRGATKYNWDRRIWVVATPSNRDPSTWLVDIGGGPTDGGDLTGGRKDNEEVAGVFYSLLAWSD